MGQSRLLTGIILYAVFTGISFGFLFVNLQTLGSDAEVINQAGKQRMLSQRIALGVLRKQLQLSGTATKFDGNTLLADSNLMHNNHLQLVHHQEQPNRDLSTALNTLYFSGKPSLYQKIIDYTATAEKIIDVNSVEQLATLNLSLFSPSQTDQLLRNLNTVVSQYEKEARDKLAKVKDFVIGLLILHILALLVLYSLGTHTNRSLDD